jgi:hypothetical protein
VIDEEDEGEQGSKGNEEDDQEMLELSRDMGTVGMKNSMKGKGKESKGKVD